MSSPRRIEADLAAVEHACADGGPNAATRAAGYLAHRVRLRELADRADRALRGGRPPAR